MHQIPDGVKYYAMLLKWKYTEAFESIHQEVSLFIPDKYLHYES